MRMILVAVATILSGCATTGSLDYMQFREARSQNLIMQVTTAGNCQYLSSVIRSKLSSDITTACSQQSLSAYLPFRATLRSLPDGFVTDVDYLTMEQCQTHVVDPGVAVVAACAKK